MCLCTKFSNCGIYLKSVLQLSIMLCNTTESHDTDAHKFDALDRDHPPSFLFANAALTQLH